MTVVNPFACSTERKTSYASSSVTRRGEMIVIFPCTRSSKMKFFFVCSLMNLMRTGSSTSVKSIDRYTGGWATGAMDGPGAGAAAGSAEGAGAGGRHGGRGGCGSRGRIDDGLCPGSGVFLPGRRGGRSRRHRGRFGSGCGRRSRHGGHVVRRRLGRVRGGPEGDQAGDQQDRNSHGILPDHRISYVSVFF